MATRLLIFVCFVALARSSPFWGGSVFPNDAHKWYDTKKHLVESEDKTNDSEHETCQTEYCEKIAEEFASSVNKSVDPCEDFYDYVCGAWTDKQIPPSLPSWSRFQMFQYTVHHRVKGILETDPEPSDILPVRQAKKWYRSCMDTDNLQKRGMKPIESILQHNGGWPMTMDKEQWDEDLSNWADIERSYLRLTGRYTFYDIRATPGSRNETRGEILIGSPNMPLSEQLPPKYRNYSGDDYDTYIHFMFDTAKLFIDENHADVSDLELMEQVLDVIDLEQRIDELKEGRQGSETLTLEEFYDWYENNGSYSIPEKSDDSDESEDYDSDESDESDDESDSDESTVTDEPAGSGSHEMHKSHKSRKNHKTRKSLRKLDSDEDSDSDDDSDSEEVRKTRKARVARNVLDSDESEDSDSDDDSDESDKGYPDEIDESDDDEKSDSDDDSDESGSDSQEMRKTHKTRRSLKKLDSDEDSDSDDISDSEELHKYRKTHKSRSLKEFDSEEDSDSDDNSDSEELRKTRKTRKARNILDSDEDSDSDDVSDSDEMHKFKKTRKTRRSAKKIDSDEDSDSDDISDSEELRKTRKTRNMLDSNEDSDSDDVSDSDEMHKFKKTRKTHKTRKSSKKIDSDEDSGFDDNSDSEELSKTSKHRKARNMLDSDESSDSDDDSDSEEMQKLRKSYRALKYLKKLYPHKLVDSDVEADLNKLKNMQKSHKARKSLKKLNSNEISDSDEESDSSDESDSDFGSFDSGESIEVKIDWRSLIDDIFEIANIYVTSSDKVSTWEMKYIRDIGKILGETSKRTIVNYLHWNFVSSMLPYTTERARDVFFQLLMEELGVKERPPRWSECVVDMKMTDAAAYAFVEKYVTEQKETEVKGMAESVRSGLKKQIEESSWLDDDSRNYLVKKLTNMTVFIGFPDWYKNKKSVIRSYKGLAIGNEYFDNVLSFMKYTNRKRLLVMEKPPKDDDAWDMDPITVNAMYGPYDNSLTIPAADFQAPLFTSGMPDSVNYGTVGVVVGHEIGHGFDDDCINFGLDGKKTELSKAMLKNYYQRADCFIHQFDEYYGVTDPPNMDTTLVMSPMQKYRSMKRSLWTRGENIADTTGIQAVYETYKNLPNSKDVKLPGFEDMTGDQLFFFSFAALWCEVDTPKYAQKIKETRDPHSPARERVKGALSNSKGFAEAYNCPAGSPMNPDDKCGIWVNYNKQKEAEAARMRKTPYKWETQWKM